MPKCRHSVQRQCSYLCLLYLVTPLVLGGAVVAAPFSLASFLGSVTDTLTKVSPTNSTSEAVSIEIRKAPFLVNVSQSAHVGLHVGNEQETKVWHSSRRKRNVDQGNKSSTSNESASKSPLPHKQDKHKRLLLWVMLPMIVVLLLVFIALLAWYLWLKCKSTAREAKCKIIGLASKSHSEKLSMCKSNVPKSTGSLHEVKSNRMNDQAANDDSMIDARRSQLMSSVFQDLYPGKKESDMLTTTRSGIGDHEPKFIRRSYNQTTSTTSATSVEQPSRRTFSGAKSGIMPIKSAFTDKKSIKMSGIRSLDEDSSEESLNSVDEETKTSYTLQSNFTEISKVPGLNKVPSDKKAQSRCNCSRRNQSKPCEFCSRGSRIR